MMSAYLRSSVFGLALCFSLPALAGGAGSYSVKGNNGTPNTDYSGSLTITQTSKDTFKLNWVIGDEKYVGYAVGDARIMAVSFTSGGSNGSALLVEDDAGGYKSIWAFNGEKQLGIELIKPK
ncbi:MAG: hypothetical protein K2Y56_00090 [Methylobacterium sp.]|uniref:hypothetical protein n=1 Tax=Methylobacterium sp. TaxID=409 RepID=UPI0025D52D05|nr:hypothetical protein [Methylobacterium sp.]MBX9929938.1 hypothetical protein [Methylobacterium sp.]